jgi:hypothetical protein
MSKSLNVPSTSDGASAIIGNLEWVDYLLRKSRWRYWMLGIPIVYYRLVEKPD